MIKKLGGVNEEGNIWTSVTRCPEKKQTKTSDSGEPTSKKTRGSIRTIGRLVTTDLGGIKRGGYIDCCAVNWRTRDQKGTN